MAILLVRIDDRLIHGQVTEGWGRILKPDNIAIVSDEIARSGWEKELCLAALPDTMEGVVLTVDEAPELINSLALNGTHSYVLFESPRDAFRVVEKGARISALNVGGMHSEKGKREISDYIYVNDEDIRYLKALAEAGIQLDFRDLPGSDRVDVLSML